MPTLEDMPTYRCELYDELYDLVSKHHAKPLTPEYALYHTIEYVDRDIDMEAAVAVDKIPEAVPDDGEDRLTFREFAGGTADGERGTRR